MSNKKAPFNKFGILFENGRLTGVEPVLELPQSPVRNRYTIAAMLNFISVNFVPSVGIGPTSKS